ncbi:sigma-70 family RNA polymerase sigma factor [Enterocloster clostridioformis]|uniref:RNA polymerase sigma factor n=1 Tax=Enterocloster clostridioformis TaxID=1531 RepID=UPI002674FE83|nr:sigma-70 family RNA polymerase sigma factor [Enterocloster clostridioformis]
MTCTEEYKEHIEYTFHAFCKIVIRNASYTAIRTWSRKNKREISLDYLTNEKHYPFGTTDEYFKAPEQYGEYLITICGDTVVLYDELLAAALSRLPVLEREMVYLSFFKRIPQHEIGRRYGYCRSSTGYHIRKALGQLYEEMEGMKHEE